MMDGELTPPISALPASVVASQPCCSISSPAGQNRLKSKTREGLNTTLKAGQGHLLAAGQIVKARMTSLDGIKVDEECRPLTC